MFSVTLKSLRQGLKRFQKKRFSIVCYTYPDLPDFQWIDLKIIVKYLEEIGILNDMCLRSTHNRTIGSRVCALWCGHIYEALKVV